MTDEGCPVRTTCARMSVQGSEKHELEAAVATSRRSRELNFPLFLILVALMPWSGGYEHNLSCEPLKTLVSPISH